MKTAGLSTRRPRLRRAGVASAIDDTASAMCDSRNEKSGNAGSVIPCEIHAGIELRYFFLIAVEHQRRTPRFGKRTQQTAISANAPFRGLAPARMVHVRIDVGVEAVLMRVHHLPGVLRLPVGERYADDRCAVLEPAFRGREQE